MNSYYKKWIQPNGYRDVLRVGLPLVISMGSTTVLEFTDRVFLSHYSLDAIAAATPAALANLVMLFFFIGIVSYSNVFIAQYSGEGKHERVGAVLWQSIRLALIGGAFLASFYFLAAPLFEFVGHSESIKELEISYFRILTVGSGFALMSSALSCFFSGRGLTRPIMIVNIIAVLINIPLDYMLIFGIGPFPELGIAGAGIATLSAWCMQMIMFGYLIFTKRNDETYAVIRANQLDKKLLKRMTRYGLPAGVSLFLELSTFTFFILVVGNIGEVELAASNIVFAINSIFFIPLLGMGIATSTLVGQAIGRKKIVHAARATHNTLHMALLWTFVLSSFFLIIPESFVNIFAPSGDDSQSFVPIREMSVDLLRFVVIYCVFDTVYIVYAGAVKGAGDTHYMMWLMAVLGVVVLGLPLYITIFMYEADIWYAWVILSGFIVSLGVTAMWRYYNGAWKSMAVVEKD